MFFDRLSTLLANVLPKEYKGRKALKHRGERCLNCDFPLDKSDRFCPKCSQVNSTKKLQFNDLFLEFFSGLLAYDSRAMRTLRVLLFQPGKISRAYIAGKRMYYANPFRFYLSVSIVFFLLNGVLDKLNEYSDPESPEKELINIQMQQEKTNEPVAAIDSLAAGVKNSKNKPEEFLFMNIDNVTYYSETQLDSMTGSSSLDERIRMYYHYFKTNNETNPNRAITDIGHNTSTFNKWLYKKVVDLDFFWKHPKLALDFFISKLPFVIFFFIPVFALFIQLLYVRRRQFTYMEHLIFAFHVQSFFFVLLIVATLLDYILNTSLFSSLFILLFCIYLFKAMRVFYAQGIVKTFVKFVILNGLFTILASFMALVYIFLSFSLY